MMLGKMAPAASAGEEAQAESDSRRGGKQATDAAGSYTPADSDSEQPIWT